ncbi:hypothetical protein OS493_024288 [Desmophyllum pertusum]|uniref:Uncharacterized protein n=1 Tax=Desmophyllum pertusum TaxID=174260 RepID=A0A9W9YY31_9CNID|nr:hypothetical protein OS493_024288 [Desmophyllum pertusum]
MSFYVMLPSDASVRTFPDSKPSSYEVQLRNELFMPEDDWEVALATISFPDSQAYIPPDTLSVETKPATGQQEGKKVKFWVRSVLLQNADVPVKDGISFIKKMIQYLHSQFYQSLKEGTTWGDADHHEGIPMFKWMRHGEQIDLHIDNSMIHSYSQHTYLDIHIELAKSFGLVKFVKYKDCGGDEGYWLLGNSLQMKHTQLPTLPVPSSHGVINAQGDGVWWQIVDVNPRIGVKGKYKALRLHSFRDWFITDVNANFAKQFGSVTHTMFVFTTDVA